MLGRFIDSIQNPSEDVNKRVGATKQLGNSSRRSIRSVLELNDDLARYEDGKPIYLDVVSQTADRYITSAINGSQELQEEIDKYVEMCNKTLLSYFNTYVAELRTKL